MTPKPHKRIENEFQKEAKILLRDIRAFGAEMARREGKIKNATIGLISEKRETGQHYKKNILRYLSQLHTLREQSEGEIAAFAERITAAIGHAERVLPKKRAKHYRRDMWRELALALEPLSERPSKKIAALLIDENNRIVAWDGNHLCYGVDKDARLFVKGIDGGRGFHIWCAERNVIAKYLGIAAIVPPNAKLKTLHEALDKFTDTLISVVRGNDSLKKMTLVASHFPCVPCADVLAPKHEGKRMRAVKEVLTSWNKAMESALKSDRRQTTKAAQIFQKAGLPVRKRYIENCICK